MTGYGMTPAYQTGKAATADVTAQISADISSVLTSCSFNGCMRRAQWESGVKCGGWSLSETWGALFVVCYFETVSLGSAVWLQTSDLSALVSCVLGVMQLWLFKFYFTHIGV